MARGARRLPVLRDLEAPRNRSECRDAMRPCPWVACRYHLLLDAMQVGGKGALRGSLKKTRPFDENSTESILEALEAMPETCAMDVADRGAMMQTEIGVLMNLTKQRIEEIEYRALSQMQAAYVILEYARVKTDPK